MYFVGKALKVEKKLYLTGNISVCSVVPCCAHLFLPQVFIESLLVTQIKNNI